MEGQMKVNMLIENALRDNVKYKGISVRDSDKALIMWVWWQLGFRLSKEQMNQFMDMPPAETIRRCRQAIQAKGKYRASDRVFTERQWKSLVMQQNAPTASPKRIEQLTQERLV